MSPNFSLTEALAIIEKRCGRDYQTEFHEDLRVVVKSGGKIVATFRKNPRPDDITRKYCDFKLVES